MSGPGFWSSRVGERALLNPIDRISEVLFGLIIVLTFTGAISVVTSAQWEIRNMLWAALGANVAWGIVDAIIYIMTVLMERGHLALVIKQIARHGKSAEARSILKKEVGLASVMTDADLDNLAERIRHFPEPRKSHLLSWRDAVAALQIFSFVMLCTFPVALPFALMDDVKLAVMVSNGTVLLFLLVGGYLLGGYAGFRRIPTALAYAAIGAMLVGLTKALGG